MTKEFIKIETLSSFPPNWCLSTNAMTNKATVYMDIGGNRWIELDWMDSEGMRHIDNIKQRTNRGY